LSTAKELEKLKEPGKFELLATAVLCKAERDYRAILHSGLNAQGQPIKSPVDGFCRVPNSTPPHFILVEHTVEATLEKKWLFDHRTVKPTAKSRKKQLSESDDGDLLKAGQLAQTFKAEFPDAKFTVVLTTNQGLKPDFCLKVEKKAEELGVSVDFWDRSRIARFLDTEPEGQWLRKEYLGLEAEMLSESLLRNLCYKSLNEYQKLFLTSPDRWISRQIDQKIEAAIENQSCSIHLLVGNSGSGKSAAAYQIGKKHLETGGYSLWLSENVLAVSDSLTNALDKALHDLCPSLMPDAGEAVLRLLKGRERVLLIADDVNQTSSPAHLLQKLVGWSKPASSSESDAKAAPSRHLLVCPVWSGIAQSVTPDVDKTPWIGSVFIGTMTSEEGLEAVQGAALLADIELTNTEAEIFAEKLGNDPILIGLFASLLSKVQLSELNQIAENVTASFINRAIEDVSCIGDFLADEYRLALSNLTAHMLQQRKLNPNLDDIKEWVGDSSEAMKALRTLMKHGKLCRIEEGKLVFRHDLLREALLVESMGQLLNNAAEPLDIFWEPYYAEIMGQAISRYPQSEEFLQELCDRLPLALVEAICCFVTPSDEHHKVILNRLNIWINSAVSLDLMPESVLWSSYWRLTRVDSPLIIQLTEKIPRHRPILLARLRNGCTISGIQFCVTENRGGLAPFTTDSIRDQALEQAKCHHKEKILRELSQILKSDIINDEQRAGALTLAGFLGFPELENEILGCWQLISIKTQFLPNAIWAAIQCCGDNPQKCLDPLIEFWSELPDKEDEYGSSLKNCFLNELARFLPRYIRSHVVDYLVTQGNKYESLRRYLVHICEFIDTPSAVDFVVKSMAEIERSLVGKGSFLGWMPKDRNLSQISLDYLFCLFENPESDDFIKSNISQLFPIDFEPLPFEEIRKKYPNSFLFHNALHKYVKLGDFKVLPDLLNLLSADSDWFYVAHRLWCDGIKEITQNNLEDFQQEIPREFFKDSIPSHKAVANFLAKIPVEDANYLLEKYWRFLGFSDLFIQTALYIGTPESLSLVNESLNRFPQGTPIFRHLFRGTGDHTCKFLYKGRTISTSRDATLNLVPEKLQILSGYIQHFDESTIWQLSKTCQHIGEPDFGRKYLFNKLGEQERKRLYPTDEELLSDLDEYETREDGEFYVRFWLDEFDKRHEPKAKALKLINSWLTSNLNLSRFKIAAACVSNIGTRQNNALDILDKYQIDDSSDLVERIKASTKFAIYRRTLD